MRDSSYHGPYPSRGGRGGRGRGGRGRGGNSHHHAHAHQSCDDSRYATTNNNRISESSVRGDWRDLERVFRRSIHGKSYPAYKDVYGTWSFPDFTIHFDYIQGDPYASPSRIRVRVPWSVNQFPEDVWKVSKVRRVALCDYLVRSFRSVIAQSRGDVRQQSGGWKGEKGGDMTVQEVGQYVMERSSVTMDGVTGELEARCTIALPARGRTVLGDWAATIIIDNLPRYVSQGLVFSSLDRSRLYRHVETVEDSDFLRRGLGEKNLVAFVANGSILPRKSGNSDEPMTCSNNKNGVVEFISPKELLVELDTPNRGRIQGMGIQRGHITLIVGGGFHGKSTLLEALQTGMYNKIPGDGREFVVCDKAVKIRAEDGRQVSSVDISPFISHLPGGASTTCFSSQDASGSTSQASNIQEALEVGSDVLLIDEDTSATNFMVRDARMQELIAKDLEPITPFLQRIESLKQSGVSSILVVGGTGEYFSVADCVIAMKNYTASDVTLEAKAIAAKYEQAYGQNTPVVEAVTPYPPVKDRVFSMDHGEQSTAMKCKVQSLHSLIMDHNQVLDLSGVEQLVEEGQTRTISFVINFLSRRMKGPWKSMSFADALSLIDKEIDAHGLDILTSGDGVHGSLSRPRLFEIAAALNRLRTAPFYQP
jgi:predicted ABC-class ATPase